MSVMRRELWTLCSGGVIWLRLKRPGLANRIAIKRNEKIMLEV